MTKPTFQAGDLIDFHISDECKGSGTVVGLSSTGLVDFYIVLLDVDTIRALDTEWTAITVQDKLMKKREKIMKNHQDCSCRLPKPASVGDWDVSDAASSIKDLTILEAYKAIDIAKRRAVLAVLGEVEYYLVRQVADVEDCLERVANMDKVVFCARKSEISGSLHRFRTALEWVQEKIKSVK